MKIINAKSVIFAGIIVLGAVYFWPVRNVQKGPACYQTSDEQIREFVKNDFLRSVKDWNYDSQFLGTRTPSLTWGKIQRRTTDVEQEKNLLVPFLAEGPDGKRQYYGMYQCEEGYVEYASE
ncbi:YebF family protein [Klebsiella sp. S69]|uniref:YebF family protein n=1 Tax=Klebsiella sp. S69 TaxID=2767439 RepID=UPI001906661D|nr:YebF family protein [Klebsiella sp. S69]MBK0167397.1 hypothetical protein [Klebsiella sp. S69]